MYRELVQHSPLLFLATLALLMFLGVWLATIARALTQKRVEVEALAWLPLRDDEARHGR